MVIHSKVVILILVMILDGVYSGKIYGGREAVAHSRPYMVLLKLNMEDGEIDQCGGFLLNEDFVMTAAHCQAMSYEALLGVHHVNSPREHPQTIHVETAIPHLDYNATDCINDIMLLKLSSKAIIDGNVRPIALADESDIDLPNSCIVSGWGNFIKNLNFPSRTLREVSVTLIQNKQCAEDKLYCSMGESGPAKGDSGGPLVCRGTKAFGVVSKSFSLNSKQMYAYTKISDYRNWIDWVMGNYQQL